MHTVRHFSVFLVAAAALTTGAYARVGDQTQVPRDIPGTSQTPAIGTATISGTVVTAGTGQPSRRARVSLSSPEARLSRTATTDEQGRFAFSALPAGRYQLSASKPGHIAVTYGQRQPGPGRPGTPIQLADGEKFAATLQMPRGGVITGTILDEHTEANPGTMVRAMRYVVQGGERRLQQAGGGSTDDRGVYRVFGLQPGDYVICATPRNTSMMADAERLRAEIDSLRRAADNAGRTDPAQAQSLIQRAAMLQTQVPDDEQQAGYAPICYPGSTTPSSAGTIALGAGEERTGIDFQLQLVAVGAVEGMVTSPAGITPQNVQVTLINVGMDVPGLGNNSARPSADGRFRIANVAPGQYRLMARGTAAPLQRDGIEREAPAARQPAAPRPEPARLWATADVSMNGTNVSNVMLVLQPGMTVSGQIGFDGAPARPADLTRMRVALSPVASAAGGREMTSASSGRVDAAGRFTIPNVTPGTYRLTASGAGPGWFLESAVAGGQESLDFPFEVKPNQNVTNATVTFSDRQAELSGTLLDDRGAPATDYTIIVFPADQKFWTPNTRRVATARPSTDGRFTLRTLPPGDYRLATVIDPEPGAWTDPGYLEQLDPVSMSVRLAPGEKKIQNVRLSVR